MANLNLRFALYRLPAERACRGPGLAFSPQGPLRACCQPKGDKRSLVYNFWRHRANFYSVSSVVVLGKYKRILLPSASIFSLFRSESLDQRPLRHLPVGPMAEWQLLSVLTNSDGSGIVVQDPVESAGGTGCCDERIAVDRYWLLRKGLR